jgi:polysaccharide chain length determinant protein (PEP-CTERM system associated)
MLGHRELTMQDFTGMLRRRLWLVLVCTVVLFGVAMTLSYVIPPRYVSQTLVLIEQQKVPTDYVTPVLTEDLGERLASLREQILSRSRLEPIIQSFNLFAGNGSTMDDRVLATQKAIDVKPINGGPRGMPGFYIYFKASDPRTAQGVCEKILSLFVSENANARQESAEGTTEFLKQQMADAKKNLDDQDAKLAEFEKKYLGRLPDQETSNQSTLQALTTRLDAATQSLDRMEETEMMVESNVTALKRDQHDSSPTTISEDDRQRDLKALIAKKQELEGIYTPDYPDVVEINRKIADLKAQIASSPAPAAPTNTPLTESSSDSPQLRAEEAQLRAVQHSIVNAKEEQDQIKKEIAVYEGRIDSSPVVEEEYKQVTRDHDIAMQFYQSLQKKMDESSMATALEHRQEGEQFRVMDPPNLPDAPAFPNRIQFAGGGLAAGLILGLLVAALLEYRDATLRTELDIWAFTKLPTLAVLSHIDGLPKQAKDQEGGKGFSRTDIPAESVGG